jgi:leucyl aminopeptidase (aminopeptidase T)
VDDGNLQDEAAFGNLPAGEAFIAPLEGSAEGLVVFDGSLAGLGLLKEPVGVRVAGRRAIQADGDAGKWLLETLDAGGTGGRLLAELGSVHIDGLLLEPTIEVDGRQLMPDGALIISGPS